MEVILPILGAILIIWLLSRLNHSGRGLSAVNGSSNDVIQSEPNDSQRASILMDELKDSGKPIDTINVETKSIMNDNEYEGMDTPTLIKGLLKKLNSQYQENEDGSLFFTYQSERFWLQCDKESSWIRIIDLQWYECTLEKIEEVSCMQKAINISNAGQQCTAIYSIDKEENKMIVYSKCDLLISSHFPAPDQYLAAWLACFFRLKQTVVMEFEKEKQRIGVTE